MSAVTRRYRLGRRHSIGGNSRIQYVFRRGSSFPGRCFVLIYFKGRGVKYCVSVSKKVGNSVMRNRVRRRITECFRLNAPDLKPGQYVFVAREPAILAPHAVLHGCMRQVLNQAKLYRNDAT